MSSELNDGVVDASAEPTDEELEAIFNEEDGAEDSGQGAPPDDAPVGDATKPEDGATDRTQDAVTQDGAGDKGPTVESLQKALRDTQRWGHEQSQALADLRKELEELRAAREKPEKTPEKEDEVPEEFKSLYEDFPELPKAIEREVQRRLEANQGQSGPGMPAQAYLAIPENDFQKDVMYGFWDESEGRFVEGLPQAKAVHNSEPFQKWLNEKISNGETVRADSPRDAIDLYREFLGGKAEQRQAEQAKAAKRESAKDAFRDGVTPGTAPTSKDGPDDFKTLEQIFDES